jgi:hypothetical protein
MFLSFQNFLFWFLSIMINICYVNVKVMNILCSKFVYIMSNFFMSILCLRNVKQHIKIMFINDKKQKQKMLVLTP